jgi:hypothetical protein
MGSSAPELLDRRQAQARHDLWAIEMDKALFSATVPPAEDTVRQPGQFAWQSPHGSPTPVRMHAGDGAAPPAAPGASGSARAEDKEPDGTAQQDAAAAAAARSAAPAASRQNEAAAPVTAASSQPAAAAAAVAAPVAASSAALAFALVPVAGQGIAATAGVAAAVQLGAAEGPGSGQAAQAPAANAVAESPMQAAVASLPQASMAEGSAALFAAPQEEAPTEAAPGGKPPASGADEEYAQRVLHMYQQNGDVQAWIRDAQLQPNQAGALAQALALQLSAQGTRLTTLTINGREVELPKEDRPHPMGTLFDERLKDVASATFPV